MKNILSNWNFMRILRLVMAVFIIFQGFETEQWLFVIAGFIFALLPLFNIGGKPSLVTEMSLAELLVVILILVQKKTIRIMKRHSLKLNNNYNERIF